MSRRKRKIEEILRYLERIPESQFDYSKNENIRFFRNIFNLKAFFYWKKKHLPLIDTERLTELTDFGNEKYSEELHHSMIKVERGLIPGFITPLVNEISKYILKQNSNLLIADIGSGSSEATRQVLQKILKKRNDIKLTIIAFDQSKASHTIAKSNISSLSSSPQIIEKENLKQDELLKIRETSTSKITVIFASNDIFNLTSDFDKTTFDISYHSFFKHHLNKTQKEKIDHILQEKSKIVFEYDGFYNISGMTVQALYSWKDPVLLNGAVFSNLLYPKKSDLEKNKQNGKLKFYKFGNFFTYRGTYLKTYS